MAMASLTADLLARKGRATPSTSAQPLNWGPKPAEEKTPDVFETAWKKLMDSRADLSGKGSKKRVHKSLYIDDEQHHQLRMLAARTGKSQQAVMEEAVTLFLGEMQKQGSCICGKSK